MQDSSSIGGPVNDDGAEVGDVSKRRAGREQVADSVEKPRGIVVGEKRGGIEADGSRSTQGGIVDKGPGRVIGPPPAAVGSIGIGGQPGNAFRSGQVNGERQRILLVRAAAATAFERYGQFAARKDRNAPASRRMVPGQPGMFGGDLARLPLQPVTEHEAVVAGLPGATL